MAWIATLYALGLLGWEVLRHTPVAEWWPFALVDVFGVWLYAPLALLLPLGVALRRWIALRWLALPLALFAWQYAILFLPQFGHDEGIPLRLMTANLVWVNQDARAVADLVRQQRPDVVALQELGVGIADELGHFLREEYPHQVLHSSETPAGLGVLSKHPISATIPPQFGPDACACMEVGITLDGRKITVLNAHPDPPEHRFSRLGPLPIPVGFDPRGQEPTFHALVRRVEESTAPLLLLGDLNVSDRQPFYQWLARLLLDAHRESGWGFGFTFPAELLGEYRIIPLVRIDHILHDAAWEAHTVWTEAIPGSDHRAVLADLVLRRQ